MASKKDVEYFGEILEERAAAYMIHGEPYKDIVDCVAVMAEEAGEALQAVLNYKYHNGSLDHLRLEVIQTGATVVRALERIENEYRDS